jgi:MoxR-like ATPase
MREVQIERLSADSYVPSRELAYADIFRLHKLFDALFGVTNLILTGPKGNGKSLALTAWAAQSQCPMVTVDCSEDLRTSKLLGSYTLRGNETPFVLGPIPTAIEIANETGACILNFEEINALSPQAQKILNPVLDFRKRVELPEAGKVFALAPGKTLWVVGSMNTAGYGGTHQLNEDLLSRVDLVQVTYPDMEDERKLIAAALSEEIRQKVSKPLGSSTVTFLDGVLTLARETRQGKGFDYALAPRDVVQILTNFNRVGLNPALQLVLGKYEGEFRSTMKRRMLSIFPDAKLPKLAEEPG